jgi:hypothetical protein
MAAGPGGAGRGGNYERMMDEGKTGDPFAALSFVSLFFFSVLCTLLNRRRHVPRPTAVPPPPPG